MKIDLYLTNVYLYKHINLSIMSSAKDENSHAGSDVENASGSDENSHNGSVGSSIRSSMGSENDNNDNEEELATEANPIDPAFQKEFENVKQMFIQVRNQSITIQRKIIEEFQKFGKDDSSASGVPDFTNRYLEALDKFEVKMGELEKARSLFNEEMQSLQKRTEVADNIRLEKEREFQKIREMAGKNAIMTRTNRPIGAAILNSKENRLAKAENDLENYRIDFLLTKNKHKKTEEELEQQDQLSEGLHLIDFEQLKIENQSLNEKKAEKSQDLEKIRKKIVTNAHILTHVKEKLAFVRKQKEILTQEQCDMETRYGESRAKLASARAQRDKVRDDNSSLKKSSGLIGMTDLLYDFENRSNELEMIQDKISELKTKHSDLIALQHELEAKIAQRQPIDTNLIRMAQ